ncbi:MAG: hypothetical protein LBH94_04140, partial [Deltaproteobacteria bacterium]|nr:hypothetical protein [Deltaproteobacteria bacterium]
MKNFFCVFCEKVGHFLERNRRSVFLALLCGLAFCPHPVADSCAGPDEERRELWTGRMYSSTYRAGVCIRNDGEVYGALYLRQTTGAVDRYTGYGKVAGERVTARHNSGHKFEGRFVSEDTVQGELTLNNGHK